MSKPKSAEHTAMCKEEYLNKCTWYERKDVIVLGHQNGNIGDEIGKKLYGEDHEVRITNIANRDLAHSYDDWGRHDTFIFNNGLTHLDWIENQEISKIHDVVNSVLTYTMTSVSDIVKQTIDQPIIKTIVFIGSMAHNHVLNGSAPYCAAKAGLNMFAKCIAYELAPKGYRVFCINPSNVRDAPMSKATIRGLMRYRNLSLEDAALYWGSECPMGTFLDMSEIADMVAFCLTDKARYLSGNPIELAGGGR